MALFSLSLSLSRIVARRARFGNVTRKARQALRRAAVETLEQRQLLTVTYASVTGPSSAQEGSALTFNLNASSDDSSITGWKMVWGDGTTDILYGNASFASHTYPHAQNYNVSATAYDGDTPSSPDNAADGTGYSLPLSVTTTDAPFTITGSTVTVMSGQAVSGAIGTVNDDNTLEDFTDFTGTADWGDGSTSAVTFVNQGGGVALIEGSHAYTQPGNMTITLTAQDPGGSTATGMGTADATAPTIIVSGDSINATAGLAWSGEVASFTSDDPNGAYTAQITYGDGTYAYGAVSGSGAGTFTVTGTQTYASAGSFWTTIDVSDSNGGGGFGYGSAAVNLAPLSVSASNLPFQEGGFQSGGAVGTLNGAGSDPTNFAGTLSVTPQYGGTTLNYGVGFAPDGSGNLTANVTSLPLSAGNYNATLAATESQGGQTVSASANFTINVSDAPLTSSGVTLAATVNVPWTGVIANFSDPDPNATAANYTTATIYGDGTSSSLSTILGSGSFSVNVIHTYSGAGLFSPSTTITDTNGGSTTTATSTANVNLAPLEVGNLVLQTQEGQQFNGTIGTLHDDAGAYAGGNYIGVFAYNSINYPVSFTPQGGGDFAVNVSGLPYLPATNGGLGTLNVAEYSNGQSVSVSGGVTVNVADVEITVGAVNFTATAGASWTGVVGTLSDPDPIATAANYTATVDFGDGEGTSPATVVSDGSGGWNVVATHTYATRGTFSPTVSVTDNGGSTSSVSASATVLGPVVTISNVSTGVDEGKDLEVDVSGSFTQADAISLSGYDSGTISITQTSLALTDTGETAHYQVTGVSVGLTAITAAVAAAQPVVGQANVGRDIISAPSPITACNAVRGAQTFQITVTHPDGTPAANRPIGVSSSDPSVSVIPSVLTDANGKATIIFQAATSGGNLPVAGGEGYVISLDDSAGDTSTNVGVIFVDPDITLSQNALNIAPGAQLTFTATMTDPTTGSPIAGGLFGVSDDGKNSDFFPAGAGTGIANNDGQVTITVKSVSTALAQDKMTVTVIAGGTPATANATVTVGS